MASLDPASLSERQKLQKQQSKKRKKSFGSKLQAFTQKRKRGEGKDETRKGLFVIAGEAFRSGGQGSRVTGQAESYEPQIAAAQTHVALMDRLAATHIIDVQVDTYRTPYTDDLARVYGDRVVGVNVHDELLGIDGLFRAGVGSAGVDYEFVFFLRIDVFLKDEMLERFDPTVDQITWPSVTWLQDCAVRGHPRVNDIFVFVPKRFFRHLNIMIFNHNCWARLVERTSLTYDDLGTVLDTYHDSDSEKDHNPLYYIVNRPENPIWNSRGYIFNKWQAAPTIPSGLNRGSPPRPEKAEVAGKYPSDKR